jgi:hypothetical protein
MLHYNPRYVQRRTGGYMQPDLICLEGGINVYTYAGRNPLMCRDPVGTIFDIFSNILSIAFDIYSIATVGFINTNPAAFAENLGSGVKRSEDF